MSTMEPNGRRPLDYDGWVDKISPETKETRMEIVVIWNQQSRINKTTLTLCFFFESMVFYTAIAVLGTQFLNQLFGFDPTDFVGIPFLWLAIVVLITFFNLFLRVYEYEWGKTIALGLISQKKQNSPMRLLETFLGLRQLQLMLKFLSVFLFLWFFEVSLNRFHFWTSFWVGAVFFLTVLFEKFIIWSLIYLHFRKNRGESD